MSVSNSMVAILCSGAGFLLGLLVAFITYKTGFARGKDEGQELAIAQAEAARIQAYYEGQESGKETADNDYIVQVTPIYKTSKTGVIGFKKFKYEFGYEQQLLVKGLPCLDPVERIVEKSTETEIDPDELEKRLNGIMQALVSGATGNIKVLNLLKKS